MSSMMLHLTLLQAVFILFLNFIPTIDSSEFTLEETQDIVNRHNELRSQVQPEAANMRYMNWDQPLASMAQQYAELCIWDHGQVENNTSSFSPIGQNLWLLGGGKPTNLPSGVSATHAWYNEVQYYDYNTRNCSDGKVCGHYTQLVWAESYALGCGRHFCETAVEPSNPTNPNITNVWIIACNYGLAGNYNRHPYIAGPNCTKCSTNVGQCYDGLCRSCDEHNETCICRQVCHNCGILNETSCTCACQQGYIGGDCSSLCEDTHRLCGRGWYRSQCNYYQPAINKCRKMCGFCVDPDPNFVCENP